MAPSADPLPPSLPVDSHPPRPTKLSHEVLSEAGLDTTSSEFKTRNTGPLKKTGVLDSAFDFEDVTPVIGREYPKARIVEDILGAENADELIRDLAITSKYQHFN